MARIAIIALIIATALIGGKIYKQYQTDGKIDFSFDSSSSNSSMSKCVTKNGETYYGIVPEGIVCETSKPIDISIKSNASSKSPKTTITAQNFKCNGRQHCSQMTSCAEAKYFINNCPNTKMDGDGDNIPCEGQWCN